MHGSTHEQGIALSSLASSTIAHALCRQSRLGHWADVWDCPTCKLCSHCDLDKDENKLMFCDRCDRAFHTFCLDPPMRRVPEGRPVSVTGAAVPLTRAVQDRGSVTNARRLAMMCRTPSPVLSVVPLAMTLPLLLPPLMLLEAVPRW
jgi:hypothetical protein